jgi:hypothetical protein
MTVSLSMNVDERVFPRVKAPVYYRSASILGPRRRVTNISVRGVRIYSDEPLREGRRLEVELFLPTGRTLVSTVRVVWVRTLPPGSPALYDVGVEFLDLPQEAAEALTDVLEQSPLF